MSSTSRKMTCTMRGGRLHGLSLPSDMPYCSPFCVSYVHFGHHHSFQQGFVTSKIASCAQGQGPSNGVFAQLHQSIALTEIGYSVNITLYGDKSINVLSRSRCYWD